MRCPAELRSRLCARVAVIAIVAAGAAGCSSDISRFNDSPFSGSMASRSGAPPSEVTGSVPSGRVETAPLPAPSRPNVSSTGVATGGGGMASYQPPPPPPTATRLAGASAPVHQPVFGGGASTTRPAAAPAPSNGVHVVAPGETLTSIARSYGKTRPEIAKANKLDPYAQVRVGQRLTIPGVRQTRTAAAAQPNTRPASQPGVATQQLASPAAAPQRMAAAQGTATARLATPATESPEPAPAAAPVSTAETTGAVPGFRWPVRGRVIAGFGTKVNGATNDGINVAVPEGTSVKAAEDGVVAYSGNELKGYGNLVLVRHSNGFVTAYAHASEVMVKRGDQVKRGQIIAKAGQSGNASSPQLHFEIRKGSQPVDPAQYLASN